MAVGSYLSIITLNVNGLNAPAKKQRLAEHSVYIVYKRLTSKQGTHTDWMWRAGKRYSTQIETKRKQEWQYSYQIKDFKTKAVKRDKEGHYIMVKESIQEKDTTIIKIYIYST